MILVKFIVGVLFFLVLILVAPIKYDLRIKFKDKAKIFFCAKFFFGIVKYKNDGLKIFGISVKKNINAKERKIKKKKVRKNKFESKKVMRKKKFKWNEIDYAGLLEIIEPSFDLLKNIFKKLRPKKIIMLGKIGFENPEYTGYFCALESFLREIKIFNLNLKHDFNKKIFDLDICLYGRTCFWNLIFISVKYILDKRVCLFIKSNFFIKEIDKNG